VYDMSGNIWEWISEEYIRKGGSWIDESARCFCGAHDGRRGVVGSSGRVGFRCCQ
jgi:formylglycine-generating enzyme required for sulfatase activity